MTHSKDQRVLTEDNAMTGRTTRREFLQHSAETAAILTAVSTLGGVHAFAQEKPATIRLGIIGCGSIIGKFIFTCL
ncbi:MAG: hypothetical protein JW829_16865 [Pirellulales bacterium]|nr:hypothetical protein [Pirellulales bacterium]